MEALTWTGSLGSYLNPIFMILVGLLVIALIAQLVLGFFAPAQTLQANPDGTIAATQGPLGMAETGVKWLFLGTLIVVVAYIVVPLVLPYGAAGIIGEMSKRFLPVWIALIAFCCVDLLQAPPWPLWQAFRQHHRHDRFCAGDVLGVHGAVCRGFRHDPDA